MASTTSNDDVDSNAGPGVTLVASWGNRHALLRIGEDSKVSALPRAAIDALKLAAKTGTLRVGAGKPSPLDSMQLPRRTAAGVFIAKRVLLPGISDPQVVHVPATLLVKDAFRPFEQVVLVCRKPSSGTSASGSSDAAPLSRRERALLAEKEAKAKAAKMGRMLERMHDGGAGAAEAKPKSKRAKGKPRVCGHCHLAAGHNARTCPVNPASKTFVGEDRVAEERKHLEAAAEALATTAAAAEAPAKAAAANDSDTGSDDDDDNTESDSEPVAAPAPAPAAAAAAGVDSDSSDDDSDDSDDESQAAAPAPAPAPAPATAGGDDSDDTDSDSSDDSSDDDSSAKAKPGALCVWRVCVCWQGLMSRSHLWTAAPAKPKAGKGKGKGKGKPPSGLTGGYRNVYKTKAAAAVRHVCVGCCVSSCRALFCSVCGPHRRGMHLVS